MNISKIKITVCVDASKSNITLYKPQTYTPESMGMPVDANMLLASVVNAGGWIILSVTKFVRLNDQGEVVVMELMQ